MKQAIAGYQCWRDLAFLHWRVDPDELQCSVPPELTVETFDDSAWLGLVPFSMQRIRPWWAPPVPGISWFLETNVRTYVRLPNGQTGVWFFSLDASQRLAVWIAKTFWHLNYYSAVLQLQCNNDQLSAAGHRPASPNTGYRIDLSINRSHPPTKAMNGTLEHFLLERYHLFTQRPDGKLYCGEVHHEPYTFQQVEVLDVAQTMFDTCGCNVNGAPGHAVYSPGVDVAVSPLQLIAT